MCTFITKLYKYQNMVNINDQSNKYALNIIINPYLFSEFT